MNEVEQDEKLKLSSSLLYINILLLALHWFFGGALASHCCGFSCCRAQAVRTRTLVVGACGVSSSSPWALERAGFRVGACGVSSSSPWALERAGFRAGACGVSVPAPGP